MDRPLSKYRPIGPLVSSEVSSGTHDICSCSLTQEGLELVEEIRSSKEPSLYITDVSKRTDISSDFGGLVTIIISDSSEKYIKGDCVLKVDNPTIGGNEIKKQVDIWKNADTEVKDSLAPIVDYSENWLLMKKASPVTEQEFIDFIEDITSEGWFMSSLSKADVGKINGEVKIVEYVFALDEVRDEQDMKDIIKYTKREGVTP